MISSYKFLESQLKQRKATLTLKIPEMNETLDSVDGLINKTAPVNVHYELNDTLWVNATVDDTQSVYLWLGANVMLEYSTREAKALLTEKLATAKTTLRQVDEDLGYLREQITTMEVNTARVYNHDVKLRRMMK